MVLFRFDGVAQASIFATLASRQRITQDIYIIHIFDRATLQVYPAHAYSITDQP